MRMPAPRSHPVHAGHRPAANRGLPIAITALFALISLLQARGAEPAWNGALVLTQEPAGAWQASGKGGWPLRIAKPDGTRIVVLEPGKDIRVLSRGFASACDPCVSMDGKRVLFAGKKEAASPWDIQEIGIDGSDLRRITEGLGDCFEPEYLARGAIVAPDYKEKIRWIVFTSTAPGHTVEAGAERCTSLYVRSLEPIPGMGIVTWRTTYNLSSDFSPAVLSDGRVLFASWQDFPGRWPAGAPGSGGPQGRVQLFTVSWSGEDINLFYDEDAAAAVKCMACEGPDRSIIFIESDGSTADRSGSLARVLLKRPFKTREVLSRVPGRYRDPRLLPDGNLLVACAPEGKGYGLYIFDFAKGGPGAVVHDSTAWDDVDGMAIAERPEPLGRITMVNPKAKTASLTCLNVYDSDLPQVQAIPKGAAKRVLFIEGVPGGSKDAPGGSPAARVLGEAPIEEDGSFLVQILPEVPFTLQILDAKGGILAAMRSWIWLQQGDERSCIGCHADRELAPENRVTEALLKAKQWPVLRAPGERQDMKIAHPAMDAPTAQAR